MHILVILFGIGLVRFLEAFKVKTSQKILIVSIMLLIFGIFALYSISIYESFDQTLKWIPQGKRDGDPSNYFYFNKQLINIVKALVVVGITYLIPIKRFKNDRVIIAIGIGAVLLQLLVFSPIGIDLNGARGWLYIPGLGNLQPAEFFKIGFVIFFSGWLMRKQGFFEDKSLYVGMAGLLALIGLIFVLIPDLGSMVVIGMVAFVMARYAGAKLKYLILILVSGGLLSLGLISLFPQRFGYISQRLSFFVATEATAEQEEKIGRQTEQALIAVGGGGFWGQGYGKGLQKFGKIPEAQSDFIFAALSEEVGLLGNLFIIFLYFLLGRYAFLACTQMRDPYSKVIAVGVTSLILIQTFVNISVNINILPNTGLTLPFISYGGTALMVNMIEIILLYKLLEDK